MFDATFTENRLLLWSVNQELNDGCKSSLDTDNTTQTVCDTSRISNISEEDNQQSVQKSGSVRSQPTRRGVVRLVASGIVVGVAGCTSNNDGSKSSKSAVDYQDSPRNGNQCSECRYYRTSEDGESVGSCTKVEGDIAPEAWCNLYVSG
ncbi:high-potential iron-sulfur protein [Haladaptatus pallidirubidus]|uniref:high-potential iron-sulfur protein n=1 Tax=Haladaptatus pallidirubidus TaxID=1008152 RepID=UPI001D11EAA7|nr:high-potential iron-sulfur protein [Haladaptatus pallidirubidus]